MMDFAAPNMEGYVMRKPIMQKSGFHLFSHRSSWHHRYLVLHMNTLHYYQKKGDATPRRTYALMPGCTVLGPTMNTSQGLWTFQISFPDEYTRQVSRTSLMSLDVSNRSQNEEPEECGSGRHNSCSSDKEDATSTMPEGKSASTGKLLQQRRGRSAKRQQKKLDKLERLTNAVSSPDTTPKSRKSIAEFGVMSKDLCQKWVDSLRVSIEGRKPAPAGNTPVAVGQQASDQRANKLAVPRVDGHQSVGVVPHEIGASATNKKLMESLRDNSDAFQDASSLASRFATLPKNSSGNVFADHRLPSDETIASTSSKNDRVPSLDMSGQDERVDPGSNVNFSGTPRSDLLQAGPRYVVHGVEGHMVIYRELSEMGLPTFQERNDDAKLYNETIILGAVVGFTTSVLMHFAGVGSPFQFVIGLIMAFVAIYVRVNKIERATDVERPTLQTSVIVRGTPAKIFNVLVSDEARPYWDVASSSHTVLEKRDDHCDIVHIIQRPVWLAPFCLWSRARELVLLRYWRRERDGSYYVFFQSTEHKDAPITDQFIRGNMPSAAWIITPRREQEGDVGNPPTSKVTFMIRYDAGGIASWLNKLGGFDDTFLLPFLRSVICLSDALKSKDYGINLSANVTGEMSSTHEEDASVVSSLPASPRTGLSPSSSTAGVADSGCASKFRSRLSTVDLQKTQVNHAGIVTGITTRSVSTAVGSYAEVDATKFTIRGPQYLTNKAKINSAPAAFHLVAFDVYSFERSDDRYDVGSRKGSYPWRFKNEVQGKTSRFTYVINLILPSADNVCCVMCFQPEDPQWDTSDEPVYKLFRKFIDADEEFQKKRFKLIPQIVQGNYLIRKTVPCKPALVANKGLTVPFIRNPHYFEVDIDVSSDTTARFITKMCLGMSKSIVVDIAFLIESKDEDELPEAVLGTIRFNRLDLKTFKRIVPGESLGYNRAGKSTATPLSAIRETGERPKRSSRASTHSAVSAE
eukprot:m.673238 g.673238  ORF g.673238 m.673238 type:complete len:973 (-) comp22780_c0_seq1:278-3196(-)